MALIPTHPHAWAKRMLARGGAVVALAALLAGLLPGGVGVAANPPTAGSTCVLPGQGAAIQHVIYLQFDNVHFARDNPNVPSDLEQMPHLLNFLKDNGALLTDHHTPLISHTAVDIVTSLSGLYGDRQGIPIGNSFRYFNPDGTSTGAGSFAYWTSPLDAFTAHPTDTTPEMIGPDGKTAPAPWVPYARAGCNFGSIAVANTALENLSPDVPTVFGAGSPQAIEAQTSPDQANGDFVGIAIHCARDNPTCSAANGGVADKLPDEPGGYIGYNALFGHKYVAPQISPSGPLLDLNGNPIPTFPGFDGMIPDTTLAYVAAMQEHGVPVTYGYLSTAHENLDTGVPYGPGQKEYVDQLKSFDAGFAAFFARLAADGITPHNTLFVVTADEGDHFIGGPPAPAGCDGVTTPCQYATTGPHPTIGELSTNLTGLLATQAGITTPFAVHSDMAPNVYVTGNPAPDASATRTFERALGRLKVINPYTSGTENLALFLANPVEMELLHLVTADPARTPTVTMFVRPDYFVFAGAPNCSSPCVSIDSGFAWNHGGVSPDVNVTWLGLVGPGVRHLGIDHGIWSDHTDIRPTMLELAGLTDDYAHDGRVLFEALDPRAVPGSVRAHRETLIRLAQVYKQIDAPVGRLGLTALAVSTRALESGSATDDGTYTRLEGKLSSIVARRNSLATQASALLDGAAFRGQSLDERRAGELIAQGQALLERAENSADE